MEPAGASGRFLLGVSTSILPDESISSHEYALLNRYHVAALELTCKHIQPALDDPSLQAELVATVQAAHPPVRSFHAPYKPDRDISALDEGQRLTAVANAEAALRLARRAGVGLVVLHGSEDPIGPGERPLRCAQAKRSLATLVDTARELGLRLALELMPPEWLPAGAAEAFAMTEGLDPDVLGFCLDTTHANLTGDLSEIVLALGPRLLCTHISDNDGVKQRHWMPFEGVIDWPALMAALVKVDYRGLLTYELIPQPAGLENGLREVEQTFQRLVALAPSA